MNNIKQRIYKLLCFVKLLDKRVTKIENEGAGGSTDSTLSDILNNGNIADLPIKGSEDFSEDAEDFDFVQKKFVDDEIKKIGITKVLEVEHETKLPLAIKGSDSNDLTLRFAVLTQSLDSGGLSNSKPSQSQFSLFEYDNGYIDISMNPTDIDGIPTTNVYFGQHSMYNFTKESAKTSIENTAFGQSSLNKLTGGVGKNAAFGSQAGFNLTTGNYNTLIGYHAGRSLTTGARNTVVGFLENIGTNITNNIIIADGAGGIGFRVITNGTTTVPRQTIANIENDTTGKAVITKEYVEEGLKGFIPISGTKENSPLTGDIEISKEDSWKIFEGDENQIYHQLLFQERLRGNHYSTYLFGRDHLSLQTEGDWIIGNINELSLRNIQPLDESPSYIELSAIPTSKGLVGYVPFNKQLDPLAYIQYNDLFNHFKNLPNKSNDATYKNILGVDDMGNLAHVGYQAFKAQAESWTDDQKSEYGQILNGGFSVGTIAVNRITPPVFEKEDNDLYLILRGTGLNLHPTERKIEILQASDNTVLAEVPNGQIQTYVSGLELVFFYNFNTLGEGSYKLRITSGVNVYITSHNFQIVANVEQADLSENTFDILTSYTNTLSFATNDSVLFEGESFGESSTIPIFSAKSKEIFAQGEDWYLEVQIDNQGNFREAAQTRIAIDYSTQSQELIYQGLAYFSLYYTYTSSNRKFIRINNLTKNFTPGAEPVNGSIIFIKQGNQLVTMFDDLISTENISNNSGYSLVFQVPNRVNKETTSIQIIKAYKF